MYPTGIFDHSKYCVEYIKAGIKVFKPYEFPDIPADARCVEKCGNFVIRAFPNRAKDGHWFHGNGDGSECPCYGFHIYHPDMGNMIYASDTECVRWKFTNINHIMVEANYSDELLTEEPTKRTHVLTGHMKINTACDFIEANRTAQLRNVVLIHLSDSSSDVEQFKAMAEKVAKRPVYVAEKGLNVSLDLAPF